MNHIHALTPGLAPSVAEEILNDIKNETCKKKQLRAIRVSDDEWESWRVTAEKSGLKVSGWLRNLANNAAKSA